MSEPGQMPSLPNRGEIMQHLEALISGGCSRDDAADWAQKWIINDGYEGDYPILDEEAWELLKLVAAADLKDSPSSYFYNEKDFADWLQEIQQEPSPEASVQNSQSRSDFPGLASPAF